ncbi:hypothetical protein GGR33_004520 [Methylobacterium brachythecii]|uniref:Uncharacterized protein n=1 Tax=Methylobacterium brachythecii TaxID=1176177 RepID=A0A7W6APD1_9HYPH|nr:hypothetical protein [Methylobacterium brachythecii]MBB3904994.1 hypothetical protein [Methylobacterium brachythecii]
MAASAASVGSTCAEAPVIQARIIAASMPPRVMIAVRQAPDKAPSAMPPSSMRLPFSAARRATASSAASPIPAPSPALLICSAKPAAGAIITQVASPRLAAPLTPSTSGLPSGLPVMRWRTQPEAASMTPPAITATRRGRRQGSSSASSAGGLTGGSRLHRLSPPRGSGPDEPGRPRRGEGRIAAGRVERAIGISRRMLESKSPLCGLNDPRNGEACHS